jgi:hypothetical protein
MSSEIAISGFDYDALAPETADIVRSTAIEIRHSMHRHLSEAIASGRALLRVKEALPNGQFGKWLMSEFGWKERTAQNYMAAAKTFGDDPQRVAHLPLRLVYTIASQPAPTHDSILQRVDERGHSERDISAEITTAIRKRKQAEEAERKLAARRAKTQEQIEEERVRREREDAREARRRAKEKLETEARQAAATEAANLILEHMPDQLGALADLINKSDSWAFMIKLRELVASHAFAGGRRE